MEEYEEELDALARAEKQAKVKEENRNKVCAELLAHEPFREWLYQLLLCTDVYRTTYVKNEGYDGVAFREGRRALGLQLMADLRKADKVNFALMEDEGQRKELGDLYPVQGL